MVIPEEWRKIDGLTHYAVSNHGRVMNTDTGHILSPNLNRNGYRYVTLAKKVRKIHRLVATAFIPNPHNYPYVNHLDGNKQNNYVENLEWCTPSMNGRHAIRTGLNTTQMGIRPVVAIHLTDNIELFFGSIKECADYFELDSGTVVDILRGRSFPHNDWTMWYADEIFRNEADYNPNDDDIFVDEDISVVSMRLGTQLFQQKFPQGLRMRSLAVLGFPDYSATSTGEIWYHKTFEFLPQTVDRDGELVVKLFSIGQSIFTKKVSRLIALVFMPITDFTQKVLYRDGNKNNCKLENLQWVRSNKRFVNYSWPQTVERIEDVCRRLAAGDTIYSIAKETHLSLKIIRDIFLRKIWADISSKYTFPEQLPRNSRVTDEKLHEICRYLQAGIRDAEIARQLEIDPSIVNRLRYGHMRRDISSQYNIPNAE